MAKPLYETKTLITLEEYRKLNRALSNRRTFMLVMLIAEVILALLLIHGIRTHAVRSTIQVYIIMLVLVPIIAYFVPRYLERRMYAANDTAHNIIATTRFYKDHLETTNQRGTSSRRYADMHRIIETPTNFYLMVSKVQAVIIIKDNCHPKLIE